MARAAAWLVDALLKIGSSGTPALFKLGGLVAGTVKEAETVAKNDFVLAERYITSHVILIGVLLSACCVLCHCCICADELVRAGGPFKLLGASRTTVGIEDLEEGRQQLLASGVELSDARRRSPSRSPRRRSPSPPQNDRKASSEAPTLAADAGTGVMASLTRMATVTFASAKSLFAADGGIAGDDTAAGGGGINSGANRAGRAGDGDGASVTAADGDRKVGRKGGRGSGGEGDGDSSANGSAANAFAAGASSTAAPEEGAMDPKLKRTRSAKVKAEQLQSLLAEQRARRSSSATARQDTRRKADEDQARLRRMRQYEKVVADIWDREWEAVQLTRLPSDLERADEQGRRGVSERYPELPARLASLLQGAFQPLFDTYLYYCKVGSWIRSYTPTLLAESLPTCLPAYLPACLPTYLPACLPAHPFLPSGLPD